MQSCIARSDRDCSHVRAQEHFVAGEDSSSGDREVIATVFAAPLLNRFQGVVVVVVTTGATWASIAPKGRLEHFKRFIIRQTHDLHQRQSAGFG